MRLAAALTLLLVLATSGVTLVSRTHAQAPAGQGASAAATTDARESFRRGEAAYGAGNYEVAISEWNAAYARDPRPRIQFNLSQAYERLGQLQNAEAALVKFLDDGDPDDPTYSDANARLVALRQRLANTGVVVKGGQEGGNILVDEADWGRIPRPDRIPVTPGNHTLIVRWPGQADFRTDVFVPAGQVVEIALPKSGAGAAVVTAQPNGAATTAPLDTPPPRKSRRPLWFGIGGGLAGAGIGMIIYGAVRANAEPSSCKGEFAEFYCNPASVDKADRQSVAGFAVGGTLIAASAAFFIVGGIMTADDSAPAAHTKIPQCGFGLTSATCRLSF